MSLYVAVLIFIIPRTYEMGWCLQICAYNGEKNCPKSLLSLPPANDDLCCDAAGNISKLKVSHQWWNDLFFSFGKHASNLSVCKRVNGW